MPLHSESNQLYFDFVYSDYFNKNSEFKYLLDWSTVPEFNNTHVDRTGYGVFLSLFFQSEYFFIFLSFFKFFDFFKDYFLEIHYFSSSFLLFNLFHLSLTVILCYF